MEQEASGQAKRSEAIRRFSRQLVLEGVGQAGQQAWLRSSVAVIGRGQAAWIASRYLAAAGVKLAPESLERLELSADDGADPLTEAQRGVEAARRKLLALLPQSEPFSESSTEPPLPGVTPTGRSSSFQDPLVVVVGAGGLGCPALLGLLWAGVRRVRIIDDDVVDISNLPRQILYDRSDLGLPKVAAAKAALKELFVDAEIEAVRERLAPGNLERLFAGADLVLEGSDNFPTKFRVNAATRNLAIPAVIGGVIRYEGQTFTLAKTRGLSACYRCFFPQMPAPGAIPTCSTAGVLGPVAGAVALQQVALGLALLQEQVSPTAALSSREGALDLYDGKAGRWTRLTGQANSDCPACGTEANDPSLLGSTEDAQGRCRG